jgi:hypothetical protein
MQNRRKYKRVYLVLFTRIFERDSGKILGQLANLTSEGAMTIGETPLEVGKVYRLQMKLSKELFSKSHVEFDARCAWSKPENIAPQFFNSGFEFIKISPKDLEIITKVMKEYELHL